MDPYTRDDDIDVFCFLFICLLISTGWNDQHPADQVRRDRVQVRRELRRRATEKKEILREAQVARDGQRAELGEW